MARFGPRLPFLLKVLAPGRAISIQAHPSAEQATAVRATTGDTVYVDDWAKPELLLAISPFEVFVGMRAHPAVATLAGRLRVPRLTELVEKAAVADDPAHALLGSVLATPADEVAAFAREVVAACVRLESRGGELGDAAAAVVRVAEEHPDDIGLVVLLLMHHRVLQPGEYIDVAAGRAALVRARARHRGARQLRQRRARRADQQGGQRARAAAHRRPARRRGGRPRAGRRARARGLRQRVRPVPAVPRHPGPCPARRAPATHRVLPARPGRPCRRPAAPSSWATSIRRSCPPGRAPSTSRAPARSTSCPCPRPDPRLGPRATKAAPVAGAAFVVRRAVRPSWSPRRCGRSRRSWRAARRPWRRRAHPWCRTRRRAWWPR